MSILIKDLSLKNATGGNFTYRDIDLNKNASSPSNQIHADDIFAIKNAIINILTIKKGSRILDPTFGSDLDEYLFEPITIQNAQMLGEEIEENLQQEPRIFVQDVEIIVNKAEGTYNIELFFDIPTLTLRDITMQLNLQQNVGISFVS